MTIKERFENVKHEVEWFRKTMDEVTLRLDDSMKDIYSTEQYKRFSFVCSNVEMKENYIVMFYEYQDKIFDTDEIMTIMFPVIIIDIDKGIMDFQSNYYSNKLNSFIKETEDIYNKEIDNCYNEIKRLNNTKLSKYFNYFKNKKIEQQENYRYIIKKIREERNKLDRISCAFTPGMMQRVFYTFKKILDDKFYDSYKFTENEYSDKLKEIMECSVINIQSKG